MTRRATRTSAAAYSAIAPFTGRLRALVYKLIHEAGPRGMTALEVVDASGHERWGIQPRISELVADKAVVDSGHTRINPSGRHAIVWIVPEHSSGLRKGGT